MLEGIYQKGVADTKTQLLAQFEAERHAWSADKQGMLASSTTDLLALEKTHTAAMSAKVAALADAQQARAPVTKPMCVLEEAACLKCYTDELGNAAGGDVLKCAALVDAYRLCARAAAHDLIHRK